MRCCRALLAVVAIGLAAGVLFPFGSGERAFAEPEKKSTVDVAAVLRTAREKHGVPGMAAAVLRGREVTAIGCDGVRKAGDATKVTLDDRWHLGSDTKAMTATLCALLVEEKKLSWDRTLGKAFPDLVPAMAAGWKDVTLEQLLTNRSGAPASLDRDGLWGRLWGIVGDGPKARRALLEGVVKHPPESPPGTKFLYSNAGFSIAGHMAETVTQTPWEDLVTKRLFEPLGITSAGFGAPGTPGKVDQPWGHRGDGTPVEPGPGADNPIAIAPAGRATMTIADWAKFVALHLRAAQGDAKLLKPDSFERLETPPEGFEYAMGWGRTERDWAKGPVLTHAGSNTMWYCITWIAPKRDFAVLVACNRGGAEAEKACDEVSWELIRTTLLAGR
jgi:CubicO group peptidase (beta-lactamase class C family)